jgi:uncharacterized cupin superfamily protein
MNYTRLYTDEKGESNFEDVNIPLKDMGAIGYLSKARDVESLQFRQNDADYDWDFHNAPARQFIILLDGEIEITTSRGDVRTFSGGDILLVEDTHGKGHKTRNIKKQIRKSVFIRI